MIFSYDHTQASNFVPILSSHQSLCATSFFSSKSGCHTQTQHWLLGDLELKKIVPMSEKDPELAEQ